MTLTRRPAERGYPMRSPIEQLFNELAFMPGDGQSQPMPAMDVRETDDAYLVEVDLPGIDIDDVEVMIEGRTLTIRGRIEEEKERNAGNYLLRERRRGQFIRAVAVPGMVDVDKAESRYENGQLIVTLPKSASNRARRVDISSSTSGGARAVQTSESRSSGPSAGAGGARTSGSSGSSGSSGTSTNGGSSGGSGKSGASGGSMPSGANAPTSKQTQGSR
jgi:HSP20 family protein